VAAGSLNLRCFALAGFARELLPSLKICLFTNLFSIEELPLPYFNTVEISLPSEAKPDLEA